MPTVEDGSRREQVRLKYIRPTIKKMPKKKKSKRKKKPQNEIKRDLVFKNFQEEYGIITKKLGDRRVLLQLEGGGPEIMGIIPGRYRRRCWFDMGDLCLVSHREFETRKVDILYKYTPQEARELGALGEISGRLCNNQAHDQDDKENDDLFSFEFDDI